LLPWPLVKTAGVILVPLSCPRSERKNMPLVNVIITIVVVGLLLWLVNRYIPMQSQIKGILNGVVVIVLVLWLMRLCGLFEYLSQFKVGHS
jgi:hypothetical protein